MSWLVSNGSNRRSACALAAIVAGVAAIALSEAGGGNAASGSRVIQVRERDFRIAAPTHVRAGAVVLNVRNLGPENHELIVVRSARGRLPLRSDGLTVDEETLQHAEAGALEPGRPGAVRDLRLNLSPGRYVLFCNMEGHYLGGMHIVLQVA
jgi:uncharacterized cupredoxin-like copper-binding protein